MKKDYPDIQVKTFPMPVLKALKKASDEVYAGYAAKNPKFKEIWQDYTAYMKKARAWSMMSQYYYLKMSKDLNITK
jgi:TRAP-type mannitol/chloroaromatic compound transport system substrate-binding protein